MIVPNGKLRNQVSQNGFKYESIWSALGDIDSNLIKTALAPTIPAGFGQKPNIGEQSNNGVDEAMEKGNMRGNHLPQEKGQGGIEDPMPSASGVQPNGNQRSTGIPQPGSQKAPADQFLGPAQQEPGDAGLDPFEEERNRIRQFIGPNFGLDLSTNPDSSIQVVIQPPRGQPVDGVGLMNAFRKHIGGQWQGESTPAANTGGPLKLKYIPQSIASQKKVTKQ